MARKDVLKGLMEQAATPRPDTPAEPAARPTRGAIGAVSRSIADLKARAVVELDTMLIEAGGVADRLESDAETDRSLRESIAEHGQQVPVLVRPHPEHDGRFQIVYGRRRVLALRDLGLPVKALIRDLDDRELVLAQGQENTARRDLSFIEKVNFARQLEELGYDRKVICDALTIDKTLVSRMLSVAQRIPTEVIEMIGAAPSVGRDRWLALADLLEGTDTDPEDIEPMIAVTARSAASDDRFQAALDYLTRRAKPPAPAPRAPKPPARPLRGTDGTPLGQSRLDDTFCTLRLRRAKTAGFETWLLDNLAALHAEWQGSLRSGDDT